ncbi:hypothetical protein ES288_D05G266900v1 [Gossypium darwinii]|uniref:Uncharacterized protein n=1 Tax=Gossypium darwinii TaxID=34276 RepID=A0A5D2CK19_GOSDA|nr:hypothetical protein ES288_D05G266900v1 [Gossypium darwinii]
MADNMFSVATLQQTLCTPMADETPKATPQPLTPFSAQKIGYIGSHGVQALKRYKYSGVDHSYLPKYVLQPFWSRFVNFFPLWMPAELRRREWNYQCESRDEARNSVLGGQNKILKVWGLKITLTGFMFLVTSAVLGYVSDELSFYPSLRSFFIVVFI